MTRMGHMGEPWGSFVDIKVNALERLKVEVSKKKKGRVLLSSVTDPYQPLESEHGLTRGSLEILLEHQFPVTILTKSDLILRDLDLIQEFEVCEVGLTLTAFDDAVRGVFEPGASTVGMRVSALKKISDSGISTYVFLGPILPYLTEAGLELLFDELDGYVRHFIIDRLNIKCGNMPTIRKALSENYPNLQPLFEYALTSESDYYDALKRKIAYMCRSRSMPYSIIF
jgi:DNA repair photolyase